MASVVEHIEVNPGNDNPLVTELQKFSLSQLSQAKERLGDLIKQYSGNKQEQMLLKRGIFTYRRDLIESGLTPERVDELSVTKLLPPAESGTIFQVNKTLKKVP